MAIVQSPETDKKMEEIKEVPKYKVTPNYGAWLDEDKFVLEVALPGVAKEKVQMKALEDYFSLRADRDNIIYTLDLDLNFKIEPGKVTTKYAEGLLHVEFERYNPLQHAFTVFERKEKNAEEENYYKVFPGMYRHTDFSEKKVSVEVSIPGVKQEDVDLKILPSGFHLIAVRPEDKMVYRAESSFGMEVVPEKTTAEYFNGLLKIHAHIRDPLDDAKEVAL